MKLLSQAGASGFKCECVSASSNAGVTVSIRSSEPGQNTQANGFQASDNGQQNNVISETRRIQQMRPTPRHGLSAWNGFLTTDQEPEPTQRLGPHGGQRWGAEGETAQGPGSVCRAAGTQRRQAGPSPQTYTYSATPVKISGCFSEISKWILNFI